jgi:hypothetical protein
MALTADTGSADLSQTPYTGASSQIWQIVSKGGGLYELINKGNGLALDDPGFNKTPGTDLDVYTVNGGTNQLWTF